MTATEKLNRYLVAKDGEMLPLSTVEGNDALRQALVEALMLLRLIHDQEPFQLIFGAAGRPYEVTDTRDGTVGEITWQKTTKK